MGLDPKSVPPRGKSAGIPYWRKEFPIDAVDDTRRSRRSFLGGMTVAGGVMACGQVVFRQTVNAGGRETVWDEAPAVVLEKKLPELELGEAIQFHYPDHRSPCLLVKRKDNELVAFAQKCTHLACPVIPDAANELLRCPCHHGSFQLSTGEPLAGPPRKPLPRVKVDVAADGTLTAIAIERTG